MMLKKLKKTALSNPEVKAEYLQLEREFHLIDRLLSMRTRAGLTQEQVAERMQTQKSNVSRLEKGNSNPSWATLSKYARACGFELSLKLLRFKRPINRSTPGQ
jgi:transcriptional regulator with XRE-family HTH domain